MKPKGGMTATPASVTVNHVIKVEKWDVLGCYRSR
jgi:hypothetical protein